MSDYGRYFSLRQKVYLVNMSEERNSEVYESLSGVVMSGGHDTVELLIAHGSEEDHRHEIGRATYKLTSEALGSGIQVLADLTGISGNLFRFRMHGTLEMFQRRIVPRLEYEGRLFCLRGSFPLPFFRKEWRRVMDYLEKHGSLPGLVLEPASINLSAGGVGLTVAAGRRPTPLSMFFVELDAGLPVCALAELVWEKRIDDEIRCGCRFIHILKRDQERINRFIGDALRQAGGQHLDFTRNWVLVDRMVSDRRSAS